MPLNLTIYVDVLFLLNLIVNYIILCSTAFILCKEIMKGRVLLSAVAGSLYNVMIFFPQFEILNLIVLKLLISIVMVIIAFRYTGAFTFIKTLIVYYIINAVYGGGMYAFHHFTSLGTKMNYSNGVYYIDLPLWCVIILAFVFYFLTRLFSFLSDNSVKPQNTVTAQIDFLNQNLTVKALVDTGNSLYDPISLMPVMFVETSVFESKLSAYFLEKVTEKNINNLPELYNIYPELKLRVIPFQDICGKKDIVFAFKPRSVKILETDKSLPTTLIAFISTRLSADNSYNALIHSKI